ncbi:MAG: class I SAM-dependent methyltransferase [Deltaproteobacteria bacterium]|nr:class I SAM-dependent methyltransferase [Deltaproteobacteria bacterium]
MKTEGARTNEWVNRAVDFDNQYTEGTPLRGWPFFGEYVRKDLLLRQQIVLELMGNVQGLKILDLGCGVGRFAHLLARKGAIVTGYDISSQAIEEAKAVADREGLGERCRFHVADIADLNPSDLKYDFWIGIGLWQYLKRPAQMMGKLTQIPYFVSDLPRFAHWIHPLRRIYRTYLLGIPFKAYSYSEAKNLFSNSGMDNFKIDMRNPTIFIVNRVR